MDDRGFNQVRVTELVDVEFDIDDQGIEEPIMRLLIRARTGDQLAVEFAFLYWQQIHEVLAAAMREFAGGRRAQ